MGEWDFYVLYRKRFLLQCHLDHSEAISRNIDCHLLLNIHFVSLRCYKLSVVVVLEVWITRENRTLCCSLKVAETREVDSSLTLEATTVTYLYIYLTLVSVEANRLANKAVVALIELNAVAIEILTSRLTEHLLNIVAASIEWLLVVEVDKVRVPVGVVLVSEERSV
jgi:hypothetical protein